MAYYTGESIQRLSASVGWVHTTVGVATDDYEALRNKPCINGVELEGNVTLDELGFGVEAAADGDTIVLRMTAGGN